MDVRGHAAFIISEAIVRRFKHAVQPGHVVRVAAPGSCWRGLAVLFPAATTPKPNPYLACSGTVTRVIDGDTIDMQLASGPIRVLHAVDTPERAQP